MTDGHMPPTSKSDHISVCICTFKRPEVLALTLQGVASQITDSAFSFEVVVVDNDSKRSAEVIVRSFQKNKALHIIYDCEPEQNISLARNRAIRNARGNLIAFIDDDETPNKDWLLRLYEMIKNYSVHGVLGPVLPCFESPPPSWVLEGRFFERDRFKTGTVLDNPKYTRTGNVLFSKSICREIDQPFDPKYGLIGGEDVDFFRRLIRNDYKFVWCDGAIVYEHVPTYRCKFKYLFNRAILRGLSNSKSESLLSFSTVKSLAAIGVYTAILPGLTFLGRGIMARYAIKCADHAGKIAGMVGLFNDRIRP
jgi:glycosyltransferase involved in cell wall biosynthesis